MKHVAPALLLLAGALAIWFARSDALAPEPVRAGSAEPRQAAGESTAREIADGVIDPEPNPPTTSRADEAAERAANGAAAEDDLTDMDAALSKRWGAWACIRLGWDPNDPRGPFLGRWILERRSEDHDLIDRIEARRRNKVPIARKFNAATEARRMLLVQQLGPQAAQQVVQKLPLYRFDLTDGSWYAIDAFGQRIGFQHDDDDIWHGWERSNTNHYGFDG